MKRALTAQITVGTSERLDQGAELAGVRGRLKDLEEIRRRLHFVHGTLGGVGGVQNRAPGEARDRQRKKGKRLGDAAVGSCITAWMGLGTIQRIGKGIC